MYVVPGTLVRETFETLRACGGGRHECQVIWTSPWKQPEAIDRLVHPAHDAHGGGFLVNSDWLHRFWLELEAQSRGIRMQIHTHPGAAFHSEIDDEYPFIHTAGFLSLVVPNFARSKVGFDGCYLTELQSNGMWMQVPVSARLRILE